MSESWWLNPCKAIDLQAQGAAFERQQQLTKPTGSLGQLEQVAVQLAGLQGRLKPRVDTLWIAIFAGDHGVVAEGVSAYPQEVTGQMLANFVGGGAAISVLARQLGAQLDVNDLGTVTPMLNLPGVRHLQIGAGTANFAQGPAMTEAQGRLALEAGRDSVRRALAAGTELFIGGEMGIGNTASASAVACALLKCPAALLAGPGTGLDPAGVSHKAAGDRAGAGAACRAHRRSVAGLVPSGRLRDRGAGRGLCGLCPGRRGGAGRRLYLHRRGDGRGALRIPSAGSG